MLSGFQPLGLSDEDVGVKLTPEWEIVLVLSDYSLTKHKCPDLSKSIDLPWTCSCLGVILLTPERERRYECGREDGYAGNNPE